MGWFQEVLGRLKGQPDAPVIEPTPAPPSSTEILASARHVETQIAGRVPAAVSARVHRITATVEEMVPRLDRLGVGSQQAHTVVSTATSYLPEAVAGYLRLPRDFADRRVIADGKTSLLILCDQLDLLGATLERISDAVSRADAAALVAHGAFLTEKFASSSLSLPAEPVTGGTPNGNSAPSGDDGRLEAP